MRRDVEVQVEYLFKESSLNVAVDDRDHKIHKIDTLQPQTELPFESMENIHPDLERVPRRGIVTRISNISPKREDFYPKSG